MTYVQLARRMVSVVGALISFAVIVGFLSPWLPLADSFAHFRFHLTAALAVAVALMLVVRSQWAAGAAGAVTVAGIVGLGPALPFPGSAGDGVPEPSLTLVQFNLSFRNRSPEAVADLIRRENADVVTLQEVTNSTGRVIALLENDYPSRIRCAYAAVGAVAVISRLPKASGVSNGCVERGGLAWLRVMAGERPVTVASVHLNWPYPFSQAEQVDRLERRLKDVPQPILLAGDFNAAPWSHAVSRIAAASGTDVAGGLRFTFSLQPVPWIPAVGMPIDHVLVPAGIVPAGVKVGPGPGSDHRAVVARLALLPGPWNREARPATGGELRP